MYAMATAQKDDRRMVRDWMVERAIVQKQAANELGVSRAHLGKWLQRKRQLHQSRIPRWSEVTGIPPEIFLKGLMSGVEDAG